MFKGQSGIFGKRVEDTGMMLCDIGNTSYHFFDGVRGYKKSVKSFNPVSMRERVYYISVNSHAKKILSKLENWIDLAPFLDYSKYYSTMGIDRVVACETIQNGVIIDAGSAITVDVVRDGAFMGGFIYPGVRAMHECYKNISNALDYPFNYECDLDIMPKNSQDAISYGFLKPLYMEVMRHNAEIYLTGGDAPKLHKIFSHAKVDEYLLFRGMQKIVHRLQNQ